jgi:hexulose-6-phosphate isomerase
MALAAAAFPPDSPLERILLEAAKAGFQAAELAIDETGPVTWTTAQEDCVCLARQAVRAGVAISALVVTDAASVNLAAPNPAARRSARDRLAAALERAAWLGAGVVAFSPAAVGGAGSAEPAVRYEDAYSLTLEALLELRFEAERQAVRLAPLACRNRFLLSPLETRDLIDRINSPWVGAGLDVGDLLPLGSPADWIVSLGHRLAHVRIGASAHGQNAEWRIENVESSAGTSADSHGVPVGASVSTFSILHSQLVMKALRQARYDGALTLLADDLPAALRLAAMLRQAEQPAGA